MMFYGTYTVSMIAKKKKNFVHKYMYESQQKKTDINFNFRILEFVIIIYLLLQN